MIIKNLAMWSNLPNCELPNLNGSGEIISSSCESESAQTSSRQDICAPHIFSVSVPHIGEVMFMLQ